MVSPKRLAQIEKKERVIQRRRFDSLNKWLPHPTLPGWGVAGTLACLITIAARTSNNTLYFLAASLICLLFVCGVINRRCIVGLRMTRNLPHPIVAGIEFTTEIRLSNSNRFLPALELSVTDGVSAQRMPLFKQGWIGAVDPGESTHVRIAGILFQRGRVELDGLVGETLFPAGLFRTRTEVGPKDEVIVYPRQGSFRDAPSPAGEEYREHQHVSLGSRSMSDVFFGLREFRPGDSPKAIHWRSSAKFDDKLLIREWEAVRMQPVCIVVDIPGKNRGIARVSQVAFDRQLALAVTLAIHYCKRGHDVTVFAAALPGNEMAVSQDQSRLYPFLDHFSVLEPVDLSDEHDLFKGRLTAGQPGIFDVVLSHRAELSHLCSPAQHWIGPQEMRDGFHHSAQGSRRLIKSGGVKGRSAVNSGDRLRHVAGGS